MLTMKGLVNHNRWCLILDVLMSGRKFPGDNESVDGQRYPALHGFPSRICKRPEH